MQRVLAIAPCQTTHGLALEFCFYPLFLGLVYLCAAGSAAAAASPRRAGGNRIQPADLLQPDCGRGPALAAGTKVPRAPPDPLLGAAGAPSSRRTAGCGVEQARCGGEAGSVEGKRERKRASAGRAGTGARQPAVTRCFSAQPPPMFQARRGAEKPGSGGRGAAACTGRASASPTWRFRLGRPSSTSQPGIATGPPCPLSAPWGRKGHRAEREARTVFIGRCTHCRGYAKDQRETTFSLPEVPIPLYCSLGAQPLLSRLGPPSWSTGWLQPSPDLDPTWASKLLDFALPRPCLK